MKDEKMYMNTETGTVDTRDGWIYECEELGRVDPVAEGELVEVAWSKDLGQWVEV
jgi:hypothetical protein